MMQAKKASRSKLNSVFSSQDCSKIITLNFLNKESSTFSDIMDNSQVIILKLLNRAVTPSPDSAKPH